MFLYLGPVLFGFLIGFALGTRINNSSNSEIKFTIGSFIVIFIIALFISWQLGQFAYYNDVPLASGFISAAAGLIVGKFLLGD